jgi:hypothetical protein
MVVQPLQSFTAAQQANTRNLNRGWRPMLPEWSQRVLKHILSGEGRDLLRMLSTANRHTEVGIVEAYQESAAFNALPPDDQQRIEIRVVGRGIHLKMLGYRDLS